jgi:WD40 repeat protein
MAVDADARSSAPAIAARYDAFMSYAHASDGTFAPVLQENVEKFAKPWNRIRALRVFRDDSSLSAEPALWSSIERALSQSEWFLLLASRPAARSRWVDREVHWWIENRSLDRLLIVLTDGTIKWDEAGGDFDWGRSDAVPPALREAFAEEPRWVDASWSAQTDAFSGVDPRLQDAVADVSARIRGVAKDDLVGAAVREQRRTRRIVRRVRLALSALLLVALAATVFALIQRSSAIKQAEIATSRQLAAVSETELPSNLDTALLLAVKAFRTDANPQTRSALLQANLFSSHLVRFLPMGGQVATLAGSGDGSIVVAGLADGRLERRALATNQVSLIGSLDAPATNLSVDRSGRVIAATDGTRGILWRAGVGASSIGCPTGERPGSVGVSPSGRTVAVYCRAPNSPGAHVVELFDGSSGRLEALHPLGADSPFLDYAGFSSGSLILPSDSSMLLFGAGGRWQWRLIPSWTPGGSSSGGFGAHQGNVSYSGDGNYVTATNGVGTIPVWPTSQPTSFDPATAPYTAQAPISAPTSLALSPRGGKLAVADSGTVYVASVLPVKQAHPSAIELPGNGSVNTQTVSFFGGDNRLLSASGDMVALWNVNQLDRLASVQASALSPPCNACGGAAVAVSPSGREVAAVGNLDSGTVIHTLDGSRPMQALSGSYGPPVWNGERLLLPSIGQSSPKGVTTKVRVWTAAPAFDAITAAALNADGHSVTIVDAQGTVYIEDPDTGRIEKQLRTAQAAQAGLLVGQVSIDSHDSLVAMIAHGTTYIRNFKAGAPARALRHRGAAFLAFGGNRLLIQRADGGLEVWNQRGSVLERTIPGDESYSGYPPVADAGGRLVARRRTDGSTTVVDLASGAILATVPAPAPRSLGLKIGLAFSADGNKLVTSVQGLGSNASQIIARDISGNTLVKAACATAGRSLTPTDWRAYVGGAVPGDLSCR